MVRMPQRSPDTSPARPPAGRGSCLVFVFQHANFLQENQENIVCNTASRSRGCLPTCEFFAREPREHCLQHSFAISRRILPEVCYRILALPSEGAGNAGRPMRPIAACAKVVVVSTRV